MLRRNLAAVSAALLAAVLLGLGTSSASAAPVATHPGDVAKVERNAGTRTAYTDCAKKEGSMKEERAEINTLALKALIDSKATFTLIDARGPRVSEKIPGAVVMTTSPSAERVAKVVPSKDALIVTYCGSLACPMSHNLAMHLQELGYRHVIEYPKGIKGWVDDGQKVEKVK